MIRSIKTEKSGMMYYLHQHFVPNGTLDVAAGHFFTNIMPLTGLFRKYLQKNLDAFALH